MPANHSLLRVGMARMHEPRKFIPNLADYLDGSHPPVIPSSRPWQNDLPRIKPFPVLATDRLDISPIAAALHLQQIWTGVLKPDAPQSSQEGQEEQAIAAYREIGGYDPAEPGTDRGVDALAVLEAWRKTGLAGQQIDAFVRVNVRSEDEVRLAIDLFGGLYVGLDLRESAKTQDVWTPVRGERATTPWGSLFVAAVDYSDDRIAVVAWGQLKWMTYAFFCNHCGEAYAVINKSFVQREGENGEILRHLEALLKPARGQRRPGAKPPKAPPNEPAGDQV